MLAPSMDCKTMFTYRHSSYLLKNSTLSSIITRSVSAELRYIQSFSATPSLAEFHYPRIFTLITYIHTLASTRLQSSLQIAYISSMDTSKQIRDREAAASLPVNQPRSQTTQFPPHVPPAASVESALQDIQLLFTKLSTRSPPAQALPSRERAPQSSSSRTTRLEHNSKNEIPTNTPHSKRLGPKSAQRHIYSYTRRRVQHPGAWMAKLFGYDNLKEVLEQSNMDPNSRADIAEANALLYSWRAEVAYVRMRK
jgi:hypothetical protein